jgi:hypothetical protein
MDGAGNACVELARDAGAVLLRESDDADVVTAASPARVHALLQAVKRGALGDHII